VRLLDLIDSIIGHAENATDLRGTFDILLTKLEDPKHILTYKYTQIA
jgi:hypothetical protein